MAERLKASGDRFDHIVYHRVRILLAQVFRKIVDDSVHIGDARLAIAHRLREQFLQTGSLKLFESQAVLENTVWVRGWD